jgi:hypothetical protein
MCIRADPWTPASVQADPWTLCGRGCTHVRAYITLVRILPFCSFSPLPLVGIVGFSWQRPSRLAKREGVTSILKGDPLVFFAKQKFKGCIYPLDACVFSYAGVYVKIFKHRHRRN